MVRKAYIGAPGVIGAVIIVALSIVFFYFSDIIQSKIKKEMRLTEGSKSMERWKSFPVPIYMKFYIFEVLNPNEVQNKGEKPVLRERGPYVYRERREKKILNVSQDGSKIFYKEYKSFRFVPTKSNGSREDRFNVINIPLLTMPVVMQGENSNLADYFFKHILRPAIATERIVVYQTVDELVVKGYHVNFLDSLDKARKNIKVNFPTLPDNNFGIFYRKSCTSNAQDCLEDHVFEVETGLKNTEDTMRIVSVDGKSLLPYWTADTCNMVNGTDGTRFRPGLDKDDTIYVFNVDLCRSAHFVYRKAVNHRGIEAYRYTVTDNFYKSPKEEPDNECFCTLSSGYKFLCGYSGVLDVSRCRYGAPIALTAPHFYKVSEFFREKVVGLSPDPERHETTVDVEPRTGMTLEGKRRIQVNVMMFAEKRMKQLANVQNLTLVPLLWLEETAAMDENAAKDFDNEVTSKVTTGKALLVVGLLFGVLLITISVVLLIVRKNEASISPIRNANGRNQRRVSRTNRAVVHETAS